MQYEIKILLFAIIMTLCIIGGTKAKASVSSREEKLASETVSEVIYDAAATKTILYKIITDEYMLKEMSDKARKLFEEFSSNGLNKRNELKNALNSLLSKYNIKNLANAHVVTNAPIQTESVNNEEFMILEVKSWTEIITFADYGKMPVVKFMAGKIGMSFNSLEVGFSDGTLCMVGGKELYVHRQGQWYQKN